MSEKKLTGNALGKGKRLQKAANFRKDLGTNSAIASTIFTVSTVTNDSLLTQNDVPEIIPSPTPIPVSNLNGTTIQVESSEGSPFEGFPPVVNPQNGKQPISSEGSSFLGFTAVVIPQNVDRVFSDEGPPFFGFTPQQKDGARKRKSVDMGSAPINRHDIDVAPISAKRPSVELSAAFRGLNTVDIQFEQPINDIAAESTVTAEPQSFFKIVRGDFCQFNSQFKSAHNQCTAMAATALAFNSLKSIVDWESNDLNIILYNGQVYYMECLEKMRTSGLGKFSYDLAAVDLSELLTINTIDLHVTIELLDGRDDPHISRENVTEAFARFENNGFSNIIVSLFGRTYAVLLYRNVGDATHTYVFFDSHGRDGQREKVITDVRTATPGKSAILFFHNATDFIHFFLNENRIIAERTKYAMGQRLGLMPLTFTIAEDREYIAVCGGYNEFHPKLPLERQHKCCGIVIFSFIFSTVKSVLDWEANDLDKIIDEGSILHRNCYDHRIPLESYFNSQTTLTPRRVLNNYPYVGFEYTVHLQEAYRGQINRENIENYVRLLTNSSANFGIFVIDELSYGLLVCPLADCTKYLFIDSHGRTSRGVADGPYSAAILFTAIERFAEFAANEFRNSREFLLYPVQLSRERIIAENDIEMREETFAEIFRTIICSNGIEKDENWGGHSHCIALSVSGILHAHVNGVENWLVSDLGEISETAERLHSFSNEAAIKKGPEPPVINDYIDQVEKMTKHKSRMSLASHAVGPARFSADFSEFKKAFHYFYYSSKFKFAILTIVREQTYAICKCSDGDILFYDCHGRTAEGKHSGDLTVAIYFRTFDQLVTFLSNENEDMFLFSLEYVTVEGGEKEIPNGSDLVERAITGSFSQNDMRFGDRSRNTQCAANSVVFLAFAFVINDELLRTDIDAVLMLGDLIYISSFNKALARGTRDDTFLAAHEVEENIPVNINRLNRGIVNVHCAPNRDKEFSGNFGRTGEKSITRFFAKYDKGVFINNTRAVALLKMNNEFAIFDPHHCSIRGMDRCNGRANIFFFKDIGSLNQFLPLCHFDRKKEFILTPFTVYENRDTGRPRRGSSFIAPSVPNGFNVSQAPSVTSIRSLPVPQSKRTVKISQTPSVTSVRSVSVRKNKPTVGDNRTSVERRIDKVRKKRENERTKIIEAGKPEYMQILNKRWTLYLQKVRRTHTANVFGDKKGYIEFFNSHKGDATDDATIEAALDSVKVFLDEEHHRQLSQVNKTKNNAMVPTHLLAFGNHEEIDESNEIYTVLLLSPMDQVCPHCGELYFKEECNTRKVFRTCCNFGEIYSDLPKQLSDDYPPFLRDLLLCGLPLSKEFLDHILLYNNAFSFAALGTTTMHHMRAAGTLGPVLAIEGQIYHMAEHFLTNSTGPGMPTAQLYYLDNTVAARERVNRENVHLNYSVMLRIENILRNINPLTETYRMLKSVLAEVRARPHMANTTVHLEIVRKRDYLRARQNHLGDFGVPQSNKVAAVYTHLPSSETKNIVVFPVTGPAEAGIALHTTDPNRDDMLYPLLFPHAEQTWTYNLMRRPRPGGPDLPDKRDIVTIEDDDDDDDTGPRPGGPDEANKRDTVTIEDDDDDDTGSEAEPDVDRYRIWQDAIFPEDDAVAGVVCREEADSEEEEIEIESEEEEEPDEGRRTKKRKRITVREFFCYLLMFRFAFDPLLSAGKLSQQFIIDCYARAQDNTFEYLASDRGQHQIRSETYGALLDYVERRKIFRADIPGKKLIVMPDTIVGSRQYMKKRYSDALAVVAKYGKPTYFITMTTNSTWPEILKEIPENANPVDYPGIVARVFKAKMKELIDDVYKKHIMGRCLAYVGVVEWQKRSLPHFHFVVFISPEDRPDNGVDIDNFVSAEIPDSVKNPRLYEAVTKYMSHHRFDKLPPGTASCHIARPGKFYCPRHPKEGEQEDPDKAKPCICYICSKHFPRPFAAHSDMIKGAYPQYRRRDNGRKFVSGRGDEIDNQWIVPYNPYLLLKYDCHINVEITSSLDSIKYLFKYLHKGMDMARVKINVIDNVQIYNEFEHFIDCRYLSAGESIWKLFAFAMFYRSHWVYRLPVHLPDYQNVIFHPNDIPYALEHADSRLTAFFNLNRSDPDARQYLYAELPEHYVYDQAKKSWHKRKRGADKTLGRVYTVDYNNIELYSLRLLLLTVKGAQSYEDLRTVDGTQYDTFAEAAAALGLIEDDSMHIETFKEIINVEMPYRIRRMFANMLKFYTPQNPADVWFQFNRHMSEDYVRRGCTLAFATNLALRNISYWLQRNGKTNTYYGLPEPVFEDGELEEWLAAVRRNPELDDTEIPEEPTEQVESERLVGLLNSDQRCIFDDISNSVQDPNRGRKLFFVDGPGGSGKTFLFSAIISFVIGLGKKILVVAWTGIAASLLKGGRTVHSVFKLPFDITHKVACNLSLSSDGANELFDVDVIVWDEISMAPCFAFEAVDALLRELMGINLPFGGKILLTSGDFRQILPVLPGATKYELLQNIVKKSDLWALFAKRSLRTNVRLSDPNDIVFAQWLIHVGDDEIRDFPGNQYYDSYVKIPSECIEPDSLLNRIYGTTFSGNDIDRYSKYAILTTLNEDVDELNSEIYSRLTEDVSTEQTYYSCDTVVDLDPNDDDAYDVSMLNSLNPPRMPPHELKLKENCIVMLLRNLNPADGLCNGTRLIVTKLYKTCIRAKILHGSFAGQEVLISRSRMDIESTELSCKFQRIQLPLRLAFAMTINKSQGQTFDYTGLYLRKPPFAHGHLYVALSRARSKDKLLIQVLPGPFMGKLVDGSDDIYVPNVVYREAL